MKTVIIDNGSKHTEKIKQFFDDVRVIAYDDSELASISDDTLVVLSGSSGMALISHLDEYQAEIELVKRHKGPLIGICFGFEVLAHAHGSWLTRSETRRSGVLDVSLTDEGRTIMDKDTVSVYEGHRWYVHEVPASLVVLARSSDGIEMIRHEKLPHYGMQFHPEVSDEPDGGALFRALITSISMI